MEKINLDEVIDNHKYKDLALLFDRADFQEDLQKLKQSIKSDNKNYPELSTFLLESKGYGAARVLAQKYKYPLGFVRAIYYAASFGKVTEDDVNNCYSTVLIQPASVLAEYKPTLTNNDLVIFINPYGIKGNIKEIIKQTRVSLREASKNIKPLSRNHPLYIDVRPNIRDIRDWYWEKKLKKTETKALMKKYNSERNTIDKATSDYSKLLRSEF